VIGRIAQQAAQDQDLGQIGDSDEDAQRLVSHSLMKVSKKPATSAHILELRYCTAALVTARGCSPQVEHGVGCQRRSGWVTAGLHDRHRDATLL
jgi:hypothetical protein